ncbi:hypothetical protein Tco_1468039 [Tanacetum coccineum]
MTQIQPADDNGMQKPNYDAKTVSKVNASYKMIPKGVHKHKNHGKRKTVINTSDDDKINSNIIFDDHYVENNGRSDEHDSTAHDQYHYELKTCKERVKTFESQTIQYTKYKGTCDELEREIRADKDTNERILKEKDKFESEFFKVENEKLITQHETQLVKKDFKEREDRYLEDIVDLEEKPKSSVDQTYFSIPSTSNICSESNEVKTDSQISKMPKESKLLKMFEKVALAINALWDRIDVTLLEDRVRRWMSDSQNSLIEFYKADVIPMSVSLSKTLKELKQ